MKVSTKIRTLASFRAPYMASTMFALGMVEANGIGTFAVDSSGRIYVDESLVGTRWTLEEAAWVMVHEVWHWALKHADRSKVILARSPETEHEQESRILNVAADLEINGGMVETGASLPSDGVFPKAMGYPIHLPMESYYELLKQQPQQPNQAQSKKCNGEGKGEGKSGGKGDSEGRGWDCGSGAHGKPRSWELGGSSDSSDSDNAEAESEAPRALTETEQELLRDALAAQIKEASKERGTVPAFAARWAEARLAPPKVAWEKELRSHISNAVTMLSGAADYTWQRPSRRGNPTGVIMPRLIKPTPEVSCVVDTSGSMSDDMVKAALAEVNGVVRAIGQREVPVICCDAIAGKAQRVQDASLVNVKGGGGTDMRIGIRESIEQCPNAKVIVLLTDGFTPYPDAMPAGYELIVALIGNQDKSLVPSYARTIVVE